MQDAQRRVAQLLGRLQAAGAEAADAAGHGTPRRALKILGAIVLIVLLTLTGAFRSAGLALGMWSLPALAPTLAWAIGHEMGWLRRPRLLAELRGRRRLAAAATAFLVLRLAWPLWATPAASAWQQAQDAYGEAFLPALHFPFGAVLAAAPMALGLVAFLLLLFAMTLAPAPRRYRQPLAPPPRQAESLRSVLLAAGDRDDRRRP